MYLKFLVSVSAFMSASKPFPTTGSFDPKIAMSEFLQTLYAYISKSYK